MWEVIIFLLLFASLCVHVCVYDLVIKKKNKLVAKL